MSIRLPRRLDFDAVPQNDSLEIDPSLEMDHLQRTQQFFPRLLQLCEQLPTQDNLFSVGRFLKYMQSHNMRWPAEELHTALFYLAPATTNHTPLEQLESFSTFLESVHLPVHQKALILEIPSLLLTSLLETYEQSPPSEEWNALFSLCKKTQCITLNIHQLLRLWPDDQQVPALMEWLERAERTPLYFETLNTLCERRPQILKKALFEGPEPHLFDRLVNESEKGLLHDFVNHFYPYLNDEAFTILFKQEDPLLHNLALSFLKKHLNEELPDFPDLGLSELSSALASGNLKLAIELIACGVSLQNANMGEVEGLNLFYAWQREHLDQPFSFAPLYRLIKSEKLSVEPLLELITLQIDRATAPKERIRLTAELLLLLKNLQEIDIFERVTLLTAKWHQKDLSNYGRMIPELKKHFDIPLLLLPLTSLVQEGGEIKLNRNEMLAYPFRDLFPNARKSDRMCLSPQAIADLQKEVPAVLFELLSKKSAETPSLRSSIFALYPRSPTIQAFAIHTHISHLLHSESRNPSNRNTFNRFLSQLNPEDVIRIFSFCVQRNHWPLVDRLREYLEEMQPDSSEWRSIQHSSFKKSTPLKSSDFQEMLSYIVKYREEGLLQPLLDSIAEEEESVKAEFQTALLSCTDSLLTFTGNRSLCQLAFAASFHEVAKKADADYAKELTKRDFFQTPVEKVIRDLESIFEKATEETLLLLIEYFTPYFNRTEFLSSDDIKSLETQLGKWAPPLMWSHWSETPLCQFHADMSALRAQGISQLTERDFRPIYEEKPFSNFTSYLSRLDRKAAETILINSLNRLVAIVPPSTLLEAVLELNYQKAAANILDRYYDQIDPELLDNICKDATVRPLSNLLSIKELTAENYVKFIARNHPATRDFELNWEALKQTVSFGVRENFQGNFNNTPFSNTSMGCAFENTRGASPWEAAYKTTIKSLESALGAEASVFVQEMLQLLQNPSVKLFQQIPLKSMHAYVTGEIDRAAFESQFNLFDLARYSKIIPVLDILKAALSEGL